MKQFRSKEIGAVEPTTRYAERQAREGWAAAERRRQEEFGEGKGQGKRTYLGKGGGKLADGGKGAYGGKPADGGKGAYGGKPADGGKGAYGGKPGSLADQGLAVRLPTGPLFYTGPSTAPTPQPVQPAAPVPAVALGTASESLADQGLAVKLPPGPLFYTGPSTAPTPTEEPGGSATGQPDGAAPETPPGKGKRR